MSLLSGLESLGLGDIEKKDLYEKKEENPAGKRTVSGKKQAEIKESDLLFDKSYTCPVCDSSFTSKTVRTGKVRNLGMDMDLRPRYENIDVNKYDVVACPHCGYAALTKNFPYMTSMQRRVIREEISSNYKPHVTESDVYTYEDAFERYKLALASAIVIHSKASDKAYICLKTGWLLRGMAEAVDPDMVGAHIKINVYEKQRKEYMENALSGFLTARQSESIPVCGMDEMTLDYLLAVLSVESEQYDVAMRFLSNVITSTTANNRIKEKARDVRDLIKEQMKEQESREE